MSISLNKSNKKAIYKRAMAKYNLEDFKGALLDFDALIKLDNSNYQAYYERALTNLQLGNSSAACEDLKIAKENGIGEAQELINKFCI
jgi:tetratricopeptide (TPR) repeat protein